MHCLIGYNSRVLFQQKAKHKIVKKNKRHENLHHKTAEAQGDKNRLKLLQHNHILPRVHKKKQHFWYFSFLTKRFI